MMSRHHRAPLGVAIPTRSARRRPRAVSAVGGRVVDFVIILVLLAPNLAWILLDLSSWNGDTATSAQTAIRLSHLLLTDRGRWLQEILGAVSTSPPLLIWWGQLLVPVGRLIGSIDSALLLLPFAAQALTLVLIYSAARALTEDRLSALVACFIIAAAPVTVTITRQFYPQPLQLLAVTWFLYIVIKAPTWDMLLTGLQVVAASAFASAVLLTAPLFCVLPGLVALGSIWDNRSKPMKLRLAHVVMLVVAVTFAAPTALWYATNAIEAIQWGWAEYGRTTETLGPGYLTRVMRWATLLFGVLRAVALVALIGVVGIVMHLGAGSESPAQLNPVRVSIAQIVLVLLVLPISSQVVPRHLISLVPFIAVVAAWGVSRFQKPWVAVTASGLLAMQLAGIHVVAWMGPQAQNRARYLTVLDAVTDATLAPATRSVMLGTGQFGVYGLDAAYHAAKLPGFFSRPPPAYHSLEYRVSAPGEMSIDAVWAQVVALEPSYLVTVNEERRAQVRESTQRDSTTTAATWSSIIVRTTEIADRVSRSPLFEIVPMVRSPDIEVYRFVGSR